MVEGDATQDSVQSRGVARYSGFQMAGGVGLQHVIGAGVPQPSRRSAAARIPALGRWLRFSGCRTVPSPEAKQ